MLKKIGLFCALSLLIASGAFAATDGGKGISVCAGYFNFTDGDVDDWVGSSLMITAEKALSSKNNVETFISLGYANASGNDEIWSDRIVIIPAMYGARKALNPDSVGVKFYAGIAGGLIYSEVKESANYLPEFAAASSVRASEYDYYSASMEKLKPGFELMGGVEFGKNMHADLTYINGGEDYNTGWSLGIGIGF